MRLRRMAGGVTLVLALLGMGGTSLAAAATSSLSATIAQTAAYTVNMLIVPRETPGPPEFYYEPTGLYVQPGESVRFVAQSPHHTVTAYHPLQGKPLRVPSVEVGPFSSPVVPMDESWTYTFSESGVYDFWCAVHEGYGMVGRVVVGEPLGPALEVSTDFGPLGTTGMAGKVLADPALDPYRIMETTAVSWAEIDPANKALPPAR